MNKPMASCKTTMTMALCISAVLWVMIAGVGQALAADSSGEREIPTEAALWDAAGQAFADGVDKSAAMQQYRLYVQSYGSSSRSSGAQYMLAECYFAAGDYEGALREYDKVDNFQGEDDYLKFRESLKSKRGRAWTTIPFGRIQISSKE